MTMLKTNLKNQVKQTTLPKWRPIIPLFEAVMNSIQSIQERHTKGEGRIVVEVHRDPSLFNDQDPLIDGFTITDNGIGLTDENFDSFNTAYSDYKEPLGGKGLGRFTWLKAFDTAQIESIFQPPNEPLHRRQFEFTNNYDPDEGIPTIVETGPLGMRVRLVGFKEPYKSQFPRSADQLVQRLVEHFLLFFLERDCPTIEVEDQGKRYSANEVFEKDFKAAAKIHRFDIRDVPFTLHGFRLTTPRLANHKLVYAANQRGVVSEYLSDYLPNFSTRLPQDDGKTFVYLAIVQSPYLTQRVNPARTDFEIATGEDADVEPSLLFEQEIRRTEIRDEALKLVQSDLADIIQSVNQAKEEKVRAYVQTDAPQYKVLMKYSREFIDKISPVASKPEIEAALHRELYDREVDMKRESSRIIKEAEKIDDYESYHRRFSEFMETYNELGAAALAQYVTHRKILLEFLKQAISRDPATHKYPLEEVVHQLVFPMRATSDDIPTHEQNLWMIDERLTFHSFVASDKRLDASPHRLESSSLLRPDLFIFDEKIVFSDAKSGEHPINAITIVEFKKPGRNDYTANDNPIRQSFKLVEEIRAGKFIVNGRPVSVGNDRIPATIYAVCDITDSLRVVLKEMDSLETPDRQGYYGFHRTYGVYYEVMDYNKLLRDAEKRNRIFFDKLNILGGFGK